MNRQRFWSLVSILAAITVVVVIFALRASRSETSVAEWRPLVWYRLDNGDSQKTLKLPLADGQRYLLVIGCLGDASKSHSVRLSGSEASHSENCWFFADRPPYRIASPVRRVSTARLCFGPTNVVETATLQTAKAESSAIVREFFLHVTDGDLDDARQYARINARRIGLGARVQVFLDQQLRHDAVSPSKIEELIRLLDDEVLPRVESQYGRVRDVDGDGRFAVVLSPWLSRLQGGRTSLGGFVRSSDFQGDVEPPFGNRCDMLLLNSQLPGESALRDLLSHEITHAACISQRLTANGRKIADEHDWLSEALAHLAEPGWSNLDYRIAAYLDDPSQYPLVVPDYYRAGLWRNHGCRGATFLFAKWCAEQHGPTLCRTLAKSQACGLRNVERATLQSFEDLFRHWSLAIASNHLGASSGKRVGEIQCEQSTTMLDLHGLVGRRGLAGVRRQLWNVDEGELNLTIRGTAFTVVELRSASPGLQPLRFDGSPGAPWQFSMCRLPDDWPDVEFDISADRQPSMNGNSVASLVSFNSLRASGAVHLRERSGKAIELMQVVCDRRQAEAKQSFCWKADELEQLTDDEAKKSGRLSFQLPFDRLSSHPGDWTIRAVVRDSAGRIATAWVSLNVPTRHENAVVAKTATAK